MKSSLGLLAPVLGGDVFSEGVSTLLLPSFSEKGWLMDTGSFWKGLGDGHKFIFV